MAAATPTVNCSVKDKDSELSYRLTAELAKLEISFAIVSASETGKEVGLFEIKNADQVVLRRNESKPFEAGSITKKSAGLKEVEKKFFYNVKLVKKKGVNLNDYFLISNM